VVEQGKREVRLDARRGLRGWHAAYGFGVRGPERGHDGVRPYLDGANPLGDLAWWPPQGVGMQGLDVSAREFSVLRSLMGAEPVPGQPLPAIDVLDRLNTLVPSDVVAVGYVDMTGLVTAVARIEPSGGARRSVLVDLGRHDQHGGPFHLGVMLWRLQPAQAEACGVRVPPGGDGIAIGFRNGTDHVVQYTFSRASSHFSPRELAILDLVGPVLQRLARERPTPRLPASLTISERRMLCEVAAGLSNAEIAEGHVIAVATVRKHLENAYRKLGVTNRIAAIARLRGSDQPGLDLQERVDRYA
jgi:DNA-binding CsgD family transcriptional regulator